MSSFSSAYARAMNTGTPDDTNPYYQRVKGLYAGAQKLFGPDYTNTVLKGVQAKLDRMREKSIASGLANLSAAGLANTSMVAGIGNRFAEEVAAPTMASAYSEAESTRRGRLASLLTQEAGWEAGRSGNRTITNTPTTSLFSRSSKPTSGPVYPTATPVSSLPRLDLRIQRPTTGTSTPQFSEAFVGDPTVYSKTGRNIGTRLTGTYDLSSGKMTEDYLAGRERRLINALKSL